MFCYYTRWLAALMATTTENCIGEKSFLLFSFFSLSSSNRHSYQKLFFCLCIKHKFAWTNNLSKYNSWPSWTKNRLALQWTTLAAKKNRSVRGACTVCGVSERGSWWGINLKPSVDIRGKCRKCPECWLRIPVAKQNKEVFFFCLDNISEKLA